MSWLVWTRNLLIIMPLSSLSLSCQTTQTPARSTPIPRPPAHPTVSCVGVQGARVRCGAVLMAFVGAPPPHLPHPVTFSLLFLFHPTHAATPSTPQPHTPAPRQHLRRTLPAQPTPRKAPAEPWRLLTPSSLSSAPLPRPRLRTAAPAPAP